MAEGDLRGAVKPLIVTDSGIVDDNVSRQASVMAAVEFGLMRRIEMER